MQMKKGAIEESDKMISKARIMWMAFNNNNNNKNNNNNNNYFIVKQLS